MGPASVPKLPFRLKVSELVQSRYDGRSNHKLKNGSKPIGPTSIALKPLVWDERVAGHDLIRTDQGELFKLFSLGSQSAPQPGWTLMLTGGDSEQGYSWTLYGIAPCGAS